jgi:hypothetical protein
MRSCVMFVLAALAALGSARGQDVSSGPEKEAAVPSLKVLDVTGAHEGKTVDYPAQRKGKPTVYVLLRADKFDRPMNRFLKGLDQAVAKDFPDAYVVAVWLTDAVDRTRELLPRVQKSVQYQATALTCVEAGPNGPKDWNINNDAHLTVVVADKQKVAAVFGYNSINETEVPRVRKALEKAAGK